MRGFVRGLGLLVLLSGFVQAQAPAAADSPAYLKNPEFLKALHEGNALLKSRQPFADDAFKRANKIAGGQCGSCLDGLWQAYMMEQSYKPALAAVDQLDKLAKTPTDKSMNDSMRGQTLLAMGGEKPKPAQLEAAHTAFVAATTENPKNASAYFSDGKTLARMGKTEDASAAFKKCVECASPKDPARLRAEHFAENPELSTHKMAPAFEVTALDGSKFNLDAMGGRVVLIDFWATWCGPCNEELPNVKKMAKDFAGQPLVIISVSWDQNEDAWKAFIQKNEMTWVQYRDSDHKLAELFGIHAIPHYFTIDSDGVLTAEVLGSGNDVEGKLKKLVAKAKAAQKQLATTTSGE